MSPLTAYVLALMMHLAPHREPKTLQPVAEAIASVSQVANDQKGVCSVHPTVSLVTVAFYETSFNNNKNTIPFGLSCCVKQCNTLTHWASVANNILNKGTRRCGYHFEKIFGHYHSGTCAADPYTVNQTETVMDLQRFHGRSIQNNG